MDYVVLARAQKVAEWKDRKEAILRGEITATESTSDADIDSIYDVQEEVSGTQYVHNCVLNVVFTLYSQLYNWLYDHCRLYNQVGELYASKPGQAALERSS